ncbi:MAG: Ku protein [Actinomycetota bacterium]
MARAIWTGSISFGLVSIPVRLHPAVSPKDVRFHEMDRRTGRRVHRRSYVREEEAPPYTDDEAQWAGGAETPSEEAPAAPPSGAGKRPAEPEPSPAPRPPERTVARDEVVKAYDVEPGMVVELDPEEIERARPEPTRIIEIEHFVELADVDPVYFEKSYHLAPAAEHANHPYALLRVAMERAGRVAIGRFVLRTKEHLVAVRPTRGILGLETLYYADEVNDPQQAWNAARDREVTERELKLSLALIDALATDWTPEEYEDRDRLRLMELIESKSAREVAPEAREGIAAPGPSVSDLMEALRASVEAAQKGRTGRGRKRSGGTGA